MEQKSIKFSKSRFVDAAVFLTLMWLFYMVDAKLGQLPEVVRWIVFLPFVFCGWVAHLFGLRTDHVVLFQLLIGLPPLVLYWYVTYAWIDRQLKRLWKLSD